MRKEILINDNWMFYMEGTQPQRLDLPHTWNGLDGQDGGNNYLRTQCKYTREFNAPELEEGGTCLLQFQGVNSECVVILNGKNICAHEGGYSTFIADITEHLKEKNVLEVLVTNKKNNRVYPQRADFTFYGGIYRDVFLITLPKNHFKFGECASPALKINANVEGEDGILNAQAYPCGEGEVVISVLDGERVVAEGALGQPIRIENVRLWNGLKDPFLYIVRAKLIVNNEVADEVCQSIGFRTFRVDAEKGFFLNGKPYPLRGVCRHQDRPKIGNALNRAHHDEDMDLIIEVGATTVRLAHYQHDQYFYDLCDKKGLIVWAEIPYISQHLSTANQNAASQMRELICQNYNHPSIVCWGISNEITIKPINKDTVNCHRELNELCHKLDPSRLTVVACYMAINKHNPTAHVSDLVSYNLYFGWYIPITALSGLKLDAYHKRYPQTPLGLSEYGAEAMPNLHSIHPRRMDNTEDYQCIYHEKMLKIINQRQYLWATHVWNMFDFAADARNQGGEPGMNHKGLVTFDRKLKKDSFYLYKAFWSEQEFVHIAGKRFQNRTGKTLKIKVYSNCKQVSLIVNGKNYQTKQADRIFEFELPFEGEVSVEAVCSTLKDSATFKKVLRADPSYKLRKKSVNKSWEK